MKKTLKYVLFVASFLLFCVLGLFILFGVKFGAFYKPDMLRLQDEGEVLVKAVHQYEKIHGRLPENKYEILSDDKNIPFEARNLLLNLQWEYVKKSSPDTFVVFKYTGHMDDVLWYGMARDESGNQQYRWEIANWK